MRKKIIISILIIATLFMLTVITKTWIIPLLTYPRTPENLVEKIVTLSTSSLHNPDNCFKIKNYLDTQTKIFVANPLFLPELCKSIAFHENKALSRYKITGIKNSSSNDEVKVVQVYFDYSGDVKRKVFLVRKENGKWKLTSQRILVKH